ncbi:MAG: hypothetical protein OXH70_17135, partial [Acidobacteria bacterium]|nr:hypothetical protein [Acidobacteriota bacterium]
RTRPLPRFTHIPHETLKSLLARHLPDVNLHYDPPSHFIYDPAAHELPAHDAVAASRHLIDSEKQPELHELTQRLHRLANVPTLSRSAYAALFRIIGAVSREGCAENLNGLTREVRDRIVEEGFQVPRWDVNRVALRLQFEGCDFRDPDGEWDPRQLAERYRSNLRSAAKDARLDLDEDQLQLLDEWLDGA